MADNFDLQGWMRENKQGAFNTKALKENIAGFTAYNPINSLREEMDEASISGLADKWDMIPGEEKEAMLDAVDDAEEGLADYAYMGWAMVPDEVKAKVMDSVMSAKVAESEPDEDEKMAAMAMKQAKKGAKAIKGLNPDKDIRDILYGDEDDDFDF